MGQFSDDGQWWWDGTAWIATSRVVLRDFPQTEFERSGKLAVARANQARARPGFWASILLRPYPAGLTSDVRRVISDYRTWTIEQLSLATAYLLGPDEPMLAGEMSRPPAWASWSRNLAVAVTAAHVIVFRIDYFDGQPRWIAMAARAAAVTMELRTVLFGWIYHALEVRGPSGLWLIQGLPGENFDPGPVLDAWRQARHSTATAR